MIRAIREKLKSFQSKLIKLIKSEFFRDISYTETDHEKL